MDTNSGASQGGKVSSTTSSISKPIPIQNTKPDRNHLSSPNFAQSAPPPRAPVIGSLPASRFLLGNEMPALELPPQTPSAQTLPSHYAQSAPAAKFLESSKPILHTLIVRKRGSSAGHSDDLNEDEGTSSKLEEAPFGTLGHGRRLRKRSTGRPHKVSFDDAFIEGEDIEEEVHENDDDFNLAAQPSLVFSAIKSLSLNDGGQSLIQHMEELTTNEKKPPTAAFVHLPKEEEEEEEAVNNDNAFDDDDGFEEQFDMDGA